LKILIFISLFLLICSHIIAQEWAVSISYINGEKSKDSHATIENFSFGDSSLSYIVAYTGHRTKDQVNQEKKCKISKAESKTLLDFILTNGLNKNDSLFQESSKTKSFEIFNNIVIAIVIDNTLYKIIINGDIVEFKDNELYTKVIQFIDLVRNLATKC
jgi:hypothetical protein